MIELEYIAVEMIENTIIIPILDDEGMGVSFAHTSTNNMI